MELSDAVDMHCHYGPDFLRPGKTIRHSVTALGAAREAAAAGFRAIVLKSHDFGNAALCTTVEEAVAGIHVFGGIALDYAVGGLNPLAVEQTLLLGGKVVWLPTVASRNDYELGVGSKHGYAGPGISVLDNDAAVLPVVHEIFELVVAHDALLATGHISPREHLAIARAFGSSGRVVVTHAGEQLSGARLGIDECVALADLGAVIELSAQTCVDHYGASGMPLEQMALMIRAIGVERCILASDYGWHDGLPRPVPGLKAFYGDLFTNGFSEAELRLMACDTPARLLGLAG